MTDTSLPSFLRRSGYTRIPLTRSGVGHFHTDGRLADRAVSVLIDTGASSTLVSLRIARDLGLPLVKLPMFGGGAGAARLDVYEIQGATFTVGAVEPTVAALLAMDLSHVNEAAALRGSGPVDAVLGADALEAHAAVIDYGSSSLYLKL
ncbi:MAG TPA: retropepsin-like aspartic protease [Pyrinomonadaceae bacterium]|jgi:predicted aspartyl protease|nr:retropepsin-like aspartic protease [Pyrinomonadaceae bacterium]